MNPDERGGAVRIFVVEDHEIVREMVRLFLAREDGREVCGAAETAEEALEALPGLEVDLLLVDVALPGMSGIDLVSSARQRWPALVCLMYSGHGEAAHVERALAAGARGYVLKGAPEELPGAVRRVMRGEQYLSPALAP